MEHFSTALLAVASAARSFALSRTAACLAWPVPRGLGSRFTKEGDTTRGRTRGTPLATKIPAALLAAAFALSAAAKAALPLAGSSLRRDAGCCGCPANLSLQSIRHLSSLSYRSSVVEAPLPKSSTGGMAPRGHP